jgi:hypothetical protein
MIASKVLSQLTWNAFFPPNEERSLLDDLDIDGLKARIDLIICSQIVLGDIAGSTRTARSFFKSKSIKGSYLLTISGVLLKKASPVTPDKIYG